MHPLKRLFQHAGAYRAQVAWASSFSILNKLFDVLPEVLIGIAVDVVVSKKSSFLAQFGVIEPERQLMLLAVITVFVWVFESTRIVFTAFWRANDKRQRAALSPLPMKNLRSFDGVTGRSLGRRATSALEPVKLRAWVDWCPRAPDADEPRAGLVA